MKRLRRVSFGGKGPHRQPVERRTTTHLNDVLLLHLDYLTGVNRLVKKTRPGLPAGEPAEQVLQAGLQD